MFRDWIVMALAAGLVFETILFYAALWTQGNRDAMLLGGDSAMLLLGLSVSAMLRNSRRLPVAKFFAYSAWPDHCTC